MRIPTVDHLTHKEDPMKEGQKVTELQKWNECVAYHEENMGQDNVTFGSYISFWLRNTPRRLLFQLSYYKFAAKLLGEGKTVLEIGCNEGFGTILLSEFSQKTVGVDIDREAIQRADINFGSDKLRFVHQDFLGADIGRFQGVVSLDTIEHIYPENEKPFFDSICRNMTSDGICIIGTPNELSNKYASELSQKVHINLYTWERLQRTMASYFQHVMLFSANDEMVHTGFYNMAHYLIAVGINKKNE